MKPISPSIGLLFQIPSSIVCLFLGFAASVTAAGNYSITDFGAVPDGKTLNTVAIQKALDVCSQSGGGTVRVPAGVYLTGTINLRDEVTLSIEEGATLLGSTDIQDYTPRHLVKGTGVKNIAIVGPGTIDGQGSAFWEEIEPETKDKLVKRTYGRAPQHFWKHKSKAPDKMIELFQCKNVKISNITLQNSESWTLDLQACENVQIDFVRIRNPFHGPNTDGIDICASQNVLVTNCDIYTGDDAVVLKNRSKIAYPHPCKNITVKNCTLASPTNGFKIGTESYGDFENIVFEDSVILAGDPKNPLCAESAKFLSPNNYDDMLGPEGGITLASVDGARIKNVRIRNITMHGARAPIYIRLANRGINPNSKEKAPVGSLEDVEISNVVADKASSPSSITAIPGYYVRNVAISNLKVANLGAGASQYKPFAVPEKEASYPGAIMWGQLPTVSLFLRHVDGIKFSDVQFLNEKPDTRPVIIMDDAVNVKIEKLTLDSEAGADPMILMNNVRDSEISATLPEKTQTWARVSGADSKNILLHAPNPQAAQKIVITSDGAENSSVKIQ